MRSAAEIREYLLARLRCALRRPGMCGSELGILNLMDYMTFIDERSGEWRGYRNELFHRKAFTAGGVTGGFQQVFGLRRHGAHDQEVASVYAVIAYEMGYLSLLKSTMLKIVDLVGIHQLVSQELDLQGAGPVLVSVGPVSPST